MEFVTLHGEEGLEDMESVCLALLGGDPGAGLRAVRGEALQAPAAAEGPELVPVHHHHSGQVRMGVGQGAEGVRRRVEAVQQPLAGPVRPYPQQEHLLGAVP